MPSVTRKSRASRATRREDVRQRMIAAVETLLEDGSTFTELSVERIIKEAGISRSTFYAYFEDKGDLLRAVTEDLTADFLGVGQAWLALPPGATRDEVRVAFAEIFAGYRRHALLMAAVVDAASYDPKVTEQFEAMMVSFHKAIADHVRKGQKAGAIDQELDATNVAAWLTWMLERGQHQLLPGATKAKADKLLTAVTDIVYKTLYGPRT